MRDRLERPVAWRGRRHWRSVELLLDRGSLRSRRASVDDRSAVRDFELDLGLTDKLAVVSGASKGIGLAIARALVAEGARVVTGSRGTSPGLSELVDGGRVYA